MKPRSASCVCRWVYSCEYCWVWVSVHLFLSFSLCMCNVCVCLVKITGTETRSALNHCHQERCCKNEMKAAWAIHHWSDSCELDSSCRCLSQVKPHSSSAIPPPLVASCVLLWGETAAAAAVAVAASSTTTTTTSGISHRKGREGDSSGKKHDCLPYIGSAWIMKICSVHCLSLSLSLFSRLFSLPPPSVAFKRTSMREKSLCEELYVKRHKWPHKMGSRWG